MTIILGVVCGFAFLAAIAFLSMKVSDWRRARSWKKACNIVGSEVPKIDDSDAISLAIVDGLNS